jgi:hypothetical protein
MVDLDFNPNGGTTTQPLSGGKLMYVNDKDSKFTSNVRFVEDVNFNKDINVDSDITATNLYVNDIYNTTPPLNIDICGNVYELTKTELNLNNKNIQNVSELNTTANSDLTVGNNSSNVTFDCDVSMNKLNVNILEVEDSGGNDLLKVDGPNKTSTFYFDSSGPSNSLILKDTNGNTSTFIKQQGTTVVMEGSDLQVGSVGVEKDINAAEVTGWFNTRDFYAIANASNLSVGTSAEGSLGYTSITNVCPGSVQIIPTSGTTIYIEPPATGVYTITVTGIWSGDAWGSGDQRQPLLTLRGPPYFGTTNPEVIAQQGATRFVDQAGSNVNYMTFNWTGRMVQSYGGSQAQYLIYAKNNGSSSHAYNGKIQVTRIC